MLYITSYGDLINKLNGFYPRSDNFTFASPTNSMIDISLLPHSLLFTECLKGNCYRSSRNKRWVLFRLVFWDTLGAILDNKPKNIFLVFLYVLGQ